MLCLFSLAWITIDHYDSYTLPHETLDDNVYHPSIGSSDHANFALHQIFIQSFRSSCNGWSLVHIGCISQLPQHEIRYIGTRDLRADLHMQVGTGVVPLGTWSIRECSRSH